ncbi:MAG: hypothetical protein KatS3mg121_1399 [Gammaproteobacteria bacterium]|nr:MAG: hypothetical protein KatS3mg121_1399 [Gammaproteobacteria bacterium]
MNPSRNTLLLVCAALLAAGPAGADWDLRGFGTLAAVRSDEPRAAFKPDLLVTEGAEDGELDWGMYSNLGVQLSWRAQRWALTGQAVARRRGDADFEPDVDWLYLKWQPQDAVDLKLGRLVMPEFMISDYRFVGYALPTIGPPAQAYVYSALTRFDGGQLGLQHDFGEVRLGVQASAGKTDADFGFMGFDYTIDVTDIRSLNATLEYRDLLLRAAHLEAHFHVFDTQGNLAFMQDAEFDALGARYDDGRWLVQGEWIDRKDLAEVYYLQLGRRFGAFQLTGTYTQADIRGFDLPDQRDVGGPALSLRYDLGSTFAIKAQWERVPTNAIWLWHSNDLMFYLQPAQDRDIYSVALDFLF